MVSANTQRKSGPRLYVPLLFKLLDHADTRGIAQKRELDLLIDKFKKRNGALIAEQAKLATPS